MQALRTACENFYWRSAQLIVPRLVNSQRTYYRTLKSYVNEHSCWLDLGCGHQILTDSIPEQEQRALVETSRRICGIDYDLASLPKHKLIKNRTVGDAQCPPFKDNSFNLVTANMVVEHIKEPYKALAEVHRILRPNGLFIFHTPNCLNYATLLARIIPNRLKKKMVRLLEDREEEDVFPTYYRMNTVNTIRKLAAANGFDIVELNLVETSAKTVMLGPFVAIELLALRMLRLKVFTNLRSDIIAVLRKKSL